MKGITDFWWTSNQERTPILASIPFIFSILMHTIDRNITIIIYRGQRIYSVNIALNISYRLFLQLLVGTPSLFLARPSVSQFLLSDVVSLRFVSRSQLTTHFPFPGHIQLSLNFVVFFLWDGHLSQC